MTPSGKAICIRKVPYGASIRMLGAVSDRIRTSRSHWCDIRHQHHKARATERTVFDPHLATLGFGGRARDRQPESSADACLGEPFKLAEDPLARSERDTRAPIAH